MEESNIKKYQTILIIAAVILAAGFLFWYFYGKILEKEVVLKQREPTRQEIMTSLTAGSDLDQTTIDPKIMDSLRAGSKKGEKNTLQGSAPVVPPDVLNSLGAGSDELRQ